jgi:hypothetical protein
MFDLSSHPFFESRRDPVTGVESFILTERVAPVQQSFYFTNPSVSADGRWLWFYAAFPPGQYRCLAAACLDPEEPAVRLFPGAAFTGSSPIVAPEGDAAYFCSRTSVWRQPLAGDAEPVCTVSDEWIGKRRFDRLATHLTLSADGRLFLLDGAVGGYWFVAVGDRESGGVEILKEFRRHHNHGQFSPTEPALFSLAQDWWNDPVSGRHFPYDHRIWLGTTDLSRWEPLHTCEGFLYGTRACHEWWSADGLMCWTDYAEGAMECDIATGRVTHVWKRPLCHTHCDPERRYWAADQSPYTWHDSPCQVLFYDRATGEEIAIASALLEPRWPRGYYHLDPHPQFSPSGDVVVYTTTARGGVPDVAIAPLEGILEAMEARKKGTS